MHANILQKFPQRADTAIAELLFGRWLLKALCIDSNKNGLVTEFPLVGFLKQNLAVVKDALTGLISSKDDFEIVMSDLPTQISTACEERRG